MSAPEVCVVDLNGPYGPFGPYGPVRSFLELVPALQAHGMSIKPVIPGESVTLIEEVDLVGSIFDVDDAERRYRHAGADSCEPTKMLERDDG